MIQRQAIVDPDRYRPWVYAADLEEAVRNGDGEGGATAPGYHGNCWAFVALVLQDTGVIPPVEGCWSWAAFLAAGAARATILAPYSPAWSGDVVVYEDAEGNRHAGVALGAFEFLHVKEGGLAVMRIGAVRRAALKLTIYRPWRLASGGAACG